MVKDLWSLLVNYRSHDGIVQAIPRYSILFSYPGSPKLGVVVLVASMWQGA